jgi:hypothetical protein
MVLQISAVGGPAGEIPAVCTENKSAIQFGGRLGTGYMQEWWVKVYFGGSLSL